MKKLPLCFVAFYHQILTHHLLIMLQQDNEGNWYDLLDGGRYRAIADLFLKVNKDTRESTPGPLVPKFSYRRFLRLKIVHEDIRKHSPAEFNKMLEGSFIRDPFPALPYKGKEFGQPYATTATLYTLEHYAEKVSHNITKLHVLLPDISFVLNVCY